MFNKFRIIKQMKNLKSWWPFFMKQQPLTQDSVQKIQIHLSRDFTKFTQKQWELLTYKGIKCKYNTLNLKLQIMKEIMKNKLQQNFQGLQLQKKTIDSICYKLTSCFNLLLKYIWMTDYLIVEFTFFLEKSFL